MAQAVIPVVLLMIVFATAVVAVMWFVQRSRARLEEFQHSGVPTLRYAVPEGQDAAVVLVALQKEGFDAVVDDVGPHHDILIAWPSEEDRDRSRARATIQHATNPEGDEIGPQQVRFADE
jgi:preprotein translocase subunit SecF